MGEITLFTAAGTEYDCYMRSAQKNRIVTLVESAALTLTVFSFLLCPAFAMPVHTSAEVQGSCAGETNIARSYEYLKQGHRLYDRFRYIGAITPYSQAIRLNPELTLAYASRSDCYKKLGQYSRALDDFNTALRLNPNDSFVLGGRGELKSIMGDVRGALEDLNQAIAMKPTYYFLFSERAKLRLKTCDFAGAIADADQALLQCPIASDLYFLRGRSYESLGLLSQALVDYNKAIELHPNWPQVYAKRASINFSLGNYGSAICDYMHDLKFDWMYFLLFFAVQALGFFVCEYEVDLAPRRLE